MYDDERSALISRYFHYTQEALPALASARGWLAVEPAHFQRIILDNLAGGVWYGRIREPAILHLSKSQLKKVVRLCEQLEAGTADFDELNERSLHWREEAGAPPDFAHYRKEPA